MHYIAHYILIYVVHYIVYSKYITYLVLVSFHLKSVKHCITTTVKDHHYHPVRPKMKIPILLRLRHKYSVSSE